MSKFPLDIDLFRVIYTTSIKFIFSNDGKFEIHTFAITANNAVVTFATGPVLSSTNLAVDATRALKKYL